MGWIQLIPNEENKDRFIFLPVDTPAPPGYKFFLRTRKESGYVISGVDRYKVGEQELSKVIFDRKMVDQHIYIECDCFIKE